MSSLTELFGPEPTDAELGGDAHVSRGSFDDILDDVVGELTVPLAERVVYNEDGTHGREKDPDWYKTPRELEREAEAAREAAEREAQADEFVTPNGRRLNLPFDLENSLSEAQRIDLENERAYQAELLEEAVERGEVEHPGLPALRAQIEAGNAEALVQVNESNLQLNQALAQHEQQLAACQQRMAYMEQVYHQAKAAHDQALADGDEQTVQQARQLIEQVTADHAQVRQAAQHAVQQAKFQQELTQGIHIAARAEAEFRAAQPDYDHAYQHIEAQFEQMQQARYPHCTPEQHQQAKAMTIAAFARQCQANGVNVAQALYEKAVELGYQPPGWARKAPPAASQGPQQAPVPAPAQPHPAKVTLAQVADMSAAEFERFYKSLEAAGTTLPAGW